MPEQSTTIADDPFRSRRPTSHERMSGRTWDASYTDDGPAPWDIGRPQPAPDPVTLAERSERHDALSRRLGPLGLRVLRANGSIDGDERAALELALEDGSWDIILATPEFATFHHAAFARPQNRASLLVVDVVDRRAIAAA